MKNGAVGNYWRIMTVNINRQNLRITGSIALFKDAAASAAGKPPLGELKVFAFNFTMPEFLASPNAVAFMYTKIVNHAETLRTHDPITGDALETPIAVDPDIAGGLTV